MLKPALTKIFISLLSFIAFTAFFSAVPAHAAVTMSLDPATATVEEGATQTVKIMLDSESQEITIGDVYFEYDSSKFEINQTDIAKGESNYNFGGRTCDFKLKGTMVDSTKVRFGFYCEDDQGVNQPFTGLVNIGKITLKALADSGSTLLSLKYIVGATAGDCNAAKDGQDFLTGVSGAEYTFTSQPDDPDETHKSCNTSNICVTVAGAGTDDCTTNSDCTSGEDDEDTYLDCVSNQCVVKEGTASDHDDCVGKYDGSSCTSSGGDDDSDDDSDDSDSYFSPPSKGASPSAIPQTAGNTFVTIIGGLAAIGLIALSILII